MGPAEAVASVGHAGPQGPGRIADFSTTNKTSRTVRVEDPSNPDNLPGSSGADGPPAHSRGYIAATADAPDAERLAQALRAYGVPVELVASGSVRELARVLEGACGEA
jgi:hypothetical protein